MNKILLDVYDRPFGKLIETIERKDTRYTSGLITYKGKKHRIAGGIRNSYRIYTIESCRL